jgi:hypothetical protein
VPETAENALHARTALLLGRKMAGPNLEVFKFGFYLFFPVAMLLHYGNPEWYAKHVTPVSVRTSAFCTRPPCRVIAENK